MEFSKQRISLLSDQVRIQTPWIKVTIGDYTFGVFGQPKDKTKSNNGKYINYNVQFPNFIQSLTITKINGQVNQYSLTINYPIRSVDDPNFFEKVFSSVSKSRKIVFSYGDMSMPAYIYRDEEAIITNITQTFNLGSSAISYIVSAVSGAALKSAGCKTYMGGFIKPSDRIKELFADKSSGLQAIFTGMPTDKTELGKYIEGRDKEVYVDTKINTSALDYIIYLASCMIPEGTPDGQLSSDIYILTIHDDASTTAFISAQDRPNSWDTNKDLHGPYFKVSRTSYKTEHADAFELDIGYNTSTIVTNFQIDQQENYALYYDYQQEITHDDFVKRLSPDGYWYDAYAAPASSRNKDFATYATDIT